MKELIRHKLQHDFKRIKTSAKWVLFSIVSGLLVGGVGTLFYFGMYVVTLTRTKNPWLIFLLPVSGILIVGCYRLLHDEKDTGTNLVLSAIHSDENLPLRTTVPDLYRVLPQRRIPWAYRCSWIMQIMTLRCWIMTTP